MRARDNTSGVGLGLRLARGLVEAMSGTLSPEATPGGGLTMIIAVPAASRPHLDADSDKAEISAKEAEFQSQPAKAASERS